MEDYIDKVASSIDFDSNSFVTTNNNLMLTKREIEILNRYGINYLKCNNLKELLFEIEDIISDMDIVDDDLDYVSQTISERDYYQNTNK